MSFASAQCSKNRNQNQNEKKVKRLQQHSRRAYDLDDTTAAAATTMSGQTIQLHFTDYLLVPAPLCLCVCVGVARFLLLTTNPGKRPCRWLLYCPVSSTISTLGSPMTTQRVEKSTLLSLLSCCSSGKSLQMHVCVWVCVCVCPVYGLNLVYRAACLPVCRCCCPPGQHIYTISHLIHVFLLPFALCPLSTHRTLCGCVCVCVSCFCAIATIADDATAWPRIFFIGCCCPTLPKSRAKLWPLPKCNGDSAAVC